MATNEMFTTFIGLREENNRLLNELLLTQKYIELLEKYRNNYKNLINICKCNENNNKLLINDLENEYKRVFNNEIVFENNKSFETNDNKVLFCEKKSNINIRAKTKKHKSFNTNKVFNINQISDHLTKNKKKIEIMVNINDNNIEDKQRHELNESNINYNELSEESDNNINYE